MVLYFHDGLRTNPEAGTNLIPRWNFPRLFNKETGYKGRDEKNQGFQRKFRASKDRKLVAPFDVRGWGKKKEYLYQILLPQQL